MTPVTVPCETCPLTDRVTLEPSTAGLLWLVLKEATREHCIELTPVTAAALVYGLLDFLDNPTHKDT